MTKAQHSSECWAFPNMEGSLPMYQSSPHAKPPSRPNIFTGTVDQPFPDCLSYSSRRATMRRLPSKLYRQLPVPVLILLALQLE